MSEKLGALSINDVELIQTDLDPTQGIGLEAEIGSICFLNVADQPFFQKYGLLDTEWKPMIASSFAQYTNTQINQNINASTNSTFITQVEILGDEKHLSNDFTKVGDNLRVNFDGFVISVANVHIWSTNPRNSPQIRFKKNGVLVGPCGSSGYIRDSSGHQESSLHVFTIIPVVINDLIGLYSRREASSGSTYLSDVGTSELILMRY